MRLLDTTSFIIHEFPGDSTEDYAILSHTWDKDECTFQDIVTRNLDPENFTNPKGFRKIQLCCEQAVRDGLSWAWIDT